MEMIRGSNLNVICILNVIQEEKTAPNNAFVCVLKRSKFASILESPPFPSG